MLEHVKAARKSQKDKLERYMGSVAGPVSADGMLERVLDSEVKTGPRPVSRSAYKRGGKVAMKAEGADAKHHAGRKARKSGGRAATTPDSMINRDVRDANELRDGKKHVGGFKSGGRTKKAMGGDFDMDDADASGAPKRKAPTKPKPSGPITDPSGGLKIPKGGYGDPYEPAPKTGPDNGPYTYKRGGKADGDLAQDKKLIKKAFREHENAEHGGKHEVLKLKKGGRAHKDMGGILSAISPVLGIAKSLGAFGGSGGGGKNTTDDGDGKKRGGRTGKAGGGSLSLDGSMQGTRPTGDRMARKGGGRAKGKTNINIIIGTGHSGQPPMANPAGSAPPLPMIKPVQMPPPGAGAPMGMPPGMPPMPPGGGAPMGPPPPGMPPMPRRHGGRTL